MASKKTQSQRILSFLRKNPDVTVKDIAKALKLPPPTVRGRVSEARKRGQKIQFFKRRVETTGTSPPTSVRRKIVKSGASGRDGRGDFSVQVFAYTYEENDTNRRSWLEDRLLDFIGDNALFIGRNTISYDGESRKPRDEVRKFYPDFEAGEE